MQRPPILTTMDRSVAVLVDASEWAPGDARPGTSPWWQLLWLMPVLVAGVVLWIAIGALAGVAAALFTAAALWVWVRSQGSLALHSVGAVPLRASGEPALLNLVRGLVPPEEELPSLWEVPDGGPNALVCLTRGPVIAVSSSLLESYSRTELEAVLAHCLVRVGDLGPLSQAVALGPLRVKFAPVVGIWEDAAAASLTRYPPALAAAIAKAEPRRDRYAALWFVAEGPSHSPQRVRVEMVLDL